MKVCFKLLFNSSPLANFVGSHEITSLYVPGLDENAPLSASVLGVDGDGRTTWALFKGQPEATDTSSYGDFGTGMASHFLCGAGKQ